MKNSNIYVDELPKRCDDCPFYKLDTYIDINYVTRTSHECVLEGSMLTGDCPLKPLTDRLAEERKKVCDELRRKAEDKYFEIGEDGEVPCGWVVSEERLQQIERDSYE